MGILDKVTKIEKRLEKLASRDDIPLQPVEIRKAALDAIEDLVQPAGRSRRVFPYNRVAIEVVAAEAGQRAAAEAVFGEPGELTAAVAERLRAGGCPVPRDLDVRLVVIPRRGPGWEAGQPFHLACERAKEAVAGGAAQAAAAPVHAQIVVLKGEATCGSYAVTGGRTNVGRIAEVLDTDGRVVRRNEVVFTESEGEINRTVSRAHAHIAWTPSGGFRLFDDGSSCGTRIFRQGRTIALPAGSPRGTKLQSGDEIYFGQACVRFDVDPSA